MPRLTPLPTMIVAALSFCPPAASAADPADRYPGLHLIPWPKKVQVGEGRLPLTAASRIVACQEELRPLAEVLSGEIALLAGLKLKVVTALGRPGDIVLRINKAIRAGEPILAVRDRQLVHTRDGAHVLAVGEQAVLEGFDYRAVAEGTATLLQAIGQSGGRVSLPRLKVHDWPHADYCGQLVDVARQDHPVAWLEKMVETCRFYKVRYLHLHLTDDQGWTFPSRRYPQLGYRNHGAHGGAAPRLYTCAELKGLVTFADIRGVTLVPELELPGHSGAALRSLPEVFDAISPDTKRPVGMGCMNMASEGIYPALDALIGEMCDVFHSSPYFHIGGDEVSMGRVSLHPGYQAFMQEHHLANDGELARHFIGRVNEMVKKRGKKAIKWEGLADDASRDIILMTWDKNNATAGRMIARGYTTITCPWDLGVPWEEWSMYVCNGSRLRKGDPVLGATLVAWEQPPQVHMAGVRSVARRQERTWGPDNSVTPQGFAARFAPLDAAVGRLVGLPVQARLKATFSASAGTCDLLDPVFTLDGDKATFTQSARPLSARDHFTIVLEQPTRVGSVEVLTGINNKGLLEGGEVQVSADGTRFETAAALHRGEARADLGGKHVRAIRLLARSDQAEPLVVREITLQRMVATAGHVRGPAAVVGEGNVALLEGNTTFAPPLDGCAVPVLNRGFTFVLDSGSSPCRYGGPIRGTGTVELHGTSAETPLILCGKEANTLQGTWQVKGRLVLAREIGVAALGGTIVVGGRGETGCLHWSNDEQVDDCATIRLLASGKAASYLSLNGFHETIAGLTMDAGTKVRTDGASGGGTLRVNALVVEGKNIPRGVYTAPSPWLEGDGYVLVGGAKSVRVSGRVGASNEAIGTGNLGVLTAASTIRLSSGECSIPFDLGPFPLTLVCADAPVRYSGFLTGHGAVRIEAPAAGQGGRPTLELAGSSSSSCKGPTVLARGMLRLCKSGAALAISGDLTLGGAARENEGDGVIWGGDGQLSPSAAVTLAGTRSSFLDLAGHKAAVARVVMSKAGMIRTGEGGSLLVKQLHIDGKRLADGIYRSPQPWLRGTGTVTVDARVDVKGRCGDCAARIGPGNVANLVGDTTFCYPLADCDVDILTNGHTVTFDSGDGNPLCCRGAISGTGNVVLRMGPSRTDYKDAPLRLAGPRPNTTRGRFFVCKGRVQLEKPDGVDAISGDVIVGGQGFNDCLFWVNSNQVKDSATITLISAGNDGAAYLHLNGCRESVAGLKMTAGNLVKTDSADGSRGELTVKSLSIDGVNRPAGIYTSASERWIEGKGKVVVRP